MSTPIAKTNDPDYLCKAALGMAPALKVMRDVLGGTPSMRGAGEEYLPKQPKERHTEYEARKKRTTFFNATKKTSAALVGMVYKDNPKLKETVPDDIRLHWENIDLAGNHGDVFTKDVFADAINDGHSFILVDMAKPVGEGATRREEMGRRPYWLRYKKDQARNWFSDRVNGEEILTQITFRECSTERDGRYGEKEIVRYRTIFLPLLDQGVDENGLQIREPSYGLVEWELTEEAKDAPEGAKFRIVDSGKTKLLRIPLSVVYGKRTGFLESEPLLLDLAYLNIDWWQQNSDYRSQLNKLVPILLRLGMPQELLDKANAAGDNQFAVGPGALADQPTESDLKYVSHDGKALEATRQALLDTEQRMAMSGLSILTQRVDSNITATEKKMDQGERTSELATAARSLRDGVELAFGFHAQLMGIADKMGDAGSIELGVAQDDLVADPQMVAQMNAMIDKNRLRVEDLLAYLQGGMKAIDFEKLREALKTMPPPVPVVPPVPPPQNDQTMNGGVQ